MLARLARVPNSSWPLIAVTSAPMSIILGDMTDWRRTSTCLGSCVGLDSRVQLSEKISLGMGSGQPDNQSKRSDSEGFSAACALDDCISRWRSLRNLGEEGLAASVPRSTLSAVPHRPDDAVGLPKTCRTCKEFLPDLVQKRGQQQPSPWPTAHRSTGRESSSRTHAARIPSEVRCLIREK